ncbi:MAG: hypothetical protein OXU74_12615 [Gemmatimonadota bacterium]|nr:hypothetical protein [Gemmatimonadota bacterium]
MFEPTVIGMRGVPVTVTDSPKVAVTWMLSPLWYVLSSPAELSARATLAPTWTVMVFELMESASSNASTTQKLKLAVPSNVATGSNFSFELEMSDREINWFTTTAVSLSVSLPAVPAGRLSIPISLRRSLWASENLKSASLNV